MAFFFQPKLSSAVIIFKNGKMGIYNLTRKQQLNSSIDEVWDFFSSPKNLKLITPDYLGFEITSPYLEKKMYQGQAITYKVSPIAGIKLDWATVITSVNAPYYFVDEQKVGPYSLWHHQHHFEENEKGVLMTDIVTYSLPWFGFGKLGHQLIVKPKLNEIFDYRYDVVENLFNIPDKSKVATPDKPIGMNV